MPQRGSHPPLLIPWSDVSIVRIQGWLFPKAEFRVSTSPNVSIKVDKEIGEKLIHERDQCDVEKTAAV